jgi:hypothetical protein
MSASGYGVFAAARHGLSSRPESLIPEGDGLRSGGTCCFAHTQQYSKSLMSTRARGPRAGLGSPTPIRVCSIGGGGNDNGSLRRAIGGLNPLGNDLECHPSKAV